MECPLKSINPSPDSIITLDCTRALSTIPTESVQLVVPDLPYLVNCGPRAGRRSADDDSSYSLLLTFRVLYRMVRPDFSCVSFYGWLGEVHPIYVAFETEKRGDSPMILKNRPLAPTHSRIKISQFSQRTVVGIPHNHMVEHFDFEELPCTNQITGHLDVRL